ncbi:DNA-directed RNA polymerases I, II, and III subunit RPABC3 [Homalodisca vitripennis]|nr:DNA-directed RNA polymerases I, II, and III subunit RPABC3 [Homalodisca vitripennis]
MENDMIDESPTLRERVLQNGPDTGCILWNRGISSGWCCHHNARGQGSDSSDWNTQDAEGSRADNFEYVMFGKIYRIKFDKNTKEPSKN